MPSGLWTEKHVALFPVNLVLYMSPVLPLLAITLCELQLICSQGLGSLHPLSLCQHRVLYVLCLCGGIYTCPAMNSPCL